MSASWYYAKGGQQQGPVSEAELKRLAETGQLQPADLVWSEGMDNWIEAGKVEFLFNLPPQASVTPPPQYEQPYQQQPLGYDQPQGYPQYPHPGMYPMPPVDRQGLAVASFVLGLVSLFAAILPCCGLPMAITGLVLGIMSRTSSKRGLAIAGIVISAIAIGLSIVSSIGVMIQFAGM